jgi:hypothetical protein
VSQTRKYETLFIRLRLAWAAFNLKPITVQIKPFHFYRQLIPDAGFCDNNDTTGCTNEAKTAMAVTEARLEVVETNFYHLCTGCACESNGKKGKLPITDCKSVSK